ncbi:MAG: MBL fold metallo-hydrolase [Verrucomicrobiota bacterium]
MLDQIRQASDGKLVLCFVGVGSAFSKRNAQTSLIIAKNGKTILVDCGTTIPQALYEKGIAVSDFDYYHITHSHADHIGGLEELLLSCRYMLGTKPNFIITSQYQDILWEKSLKGGCEYNETGLLHFRDLINPLRPEWVKAQPREVYQIDIEGIHLEIFRTIHIPGKVHDWAQAFWSTGLLIDGRVLFTADTRYDPEIFEDLDVSHCDTVFHDCQLNDPGTVHATYNELKQLPDDIRAMTHLTHYNDNFADFDPAADGFAGFAEAWKLYSWESESAATPSRTAAA